MRTPIVENHTEAQLANAAVLQRLERLSSYLKQDPENLTLLADVSDLHLQLGQWELAKATLQQIHASQPQNALACYRLAVAERALGNLPVAVGLLQDLINEGVTDPVVLLEAASAQAQADDWSATLQVLASLDATKLPAAQGDSVWLLRIRAHHHQGQVEQGLAEAEAWQLARRGQALPIGGIAAMATLNLDAERLDALAQLLLQCDAAQIGGSAELLAAAGYLELGRGEIDVAMDHFSRSTSLQPKSGRSLLGLGLAAAVKGKQAQAISMLREATRVAPGHVGSWHALAWLQLLSDDIDGAAGSFASALAQDRNFGDTHGGLALVAVLCDDQAAAAEHLAVAQRLDRGSMNAAVARILLEQGRGASLRDPELLQRGLQQFLERAASRQDGAGEMLAKVLASVEPANWH